MIAARQKFSAPAFKMIDAILATTSYSENGYDLRLLHDPFTAPNEVWIEARSTSKGHAGELIVGTCWRAAIITLEEDRAGETTAVLSVGDEEAANQWEIGWAVRSEIDYDELTYRLIQISFAHTAALVITNWWAGAIRQWWERLSVPDKGPEQAERAEDAPKPTAAAGSALEDLLDALAERIGPITQAEQPSALTQALHYRSGNVSNSVIIVGNGNVMGDGSSSRVLQATPAAPDDELISDDPRSKLLQDLDKHFSEEDLRTLCFELGVDYENLPAQGKVGKARELIRNLQRFERMPELIDRCRKLRPNISWGDTVGTSPVVAPE